MGGSRTQKRADRWLWLICAALLPTVVMLFQYRQNMFYVSRDHALLVTAGLLLLSVLAWLIAYLIFRSPFSAFAACLVGWIMCFAANAIIRGVIFPISGTMKNTNFIWGLITLPLALLAALLLRKVRLPAMVSVCVLVFLSLLFMMNSLPLLFGDATRANNEDMSQYVKTDFSVEAPAEQPNIYWIHCDGMLGFSAMEEYFGDAQERFAGELTDRGFFINRAAMFESGHNTQLAIPTLMCPYAYDSWIEPRAATHEDAMLLRSGDSAYGKLMTFRQNNELIAAFRQGGYLTQGQVHDTYGVYFPPVSDVNYYYDTFETYKIELDSPKGLANAVEWENTRMYLGVIASPLAELASICMEAPFFQGAKRAETAPLQTELSAQQIKACILQDVNEDNARAYMESGVIMLDDCLKTPGPHFTMLFTMTAHYPYRYDEDGNPVGSQTSKDIFSYPAQHRYAARVLINMVDMILAADPDAVIVLQADHGLHVATEEELMAAFGTREACLDMWNSVLSAIRVPEKYQNNEERYALENPLNISRYLVNSYVGRNYDYIE